MKNEVERYKDIARDLHDYIQTTHGVAFGSDAIPITIESLTAAIEYIDDQLEKIWMDQ